MTPVILIEEARADVLEAFSFYRHAKRAWETAFAITSTSRLQEFYPDLVVIVGVMHGRQDPAKWKRRAIRR